MEAARRVVVSGASGGIGRATTVASARECNAGTLLARHSAPCMASRSYSPRRRSNADSLATAHSAMRARPQPQQ